MYFLSGQDVRAVLTIPIKLYTVSDVDSGSSDKDNVFRLTNGTDRRMMYTFAAESREMKKRWVKDLGMKWIKGSGKGLVNYTT